MVERLRKVVARITVAGLRAELGGAEEFRPMFTATGDGWPEIEAILAGMGNTVNGSLRG